MRFGISDKCIRRVVGWIGAERNKIDIRLIGERRLQGLHFFGHDGTDGRASSEEEIGDPNVTEQIHLGNSAALFVLKRECGDRAEVIESDSVSFLAKPLEEG